MKILPVMAFLMSLFALPLPPSQASTHYISMWQAKDDKPVPKPPKPTKPIGPPTSNED